MYGHMNIKYQWRVCAVLVAHVQPYVYHSESTPDMLTAKYCLDS